MAKKKRRSPDSNQETPPKKPKKSAKKASRSKARPKAADAPGPLTDRQALEAMVRGLIDDMRGAPTESPLDRAQEIVYQAIDEPDPHRRAALAREALLISPDCADAHVLLAELAPTRKEALHFHEEAVAAGKRAISPEYFEKGVGHFWGLLETRPYMRALERLAHTLWLIGRREEAVDHLREMLRLNPNDNQGARYTLATWLLNLDRDEELIELLNRYDEDGSATWAYTRVLIAFRQGGDSPTARDLLKLAKKVNKYVPDYLTGDKPMPPELPEYYGLGDEREAILYASAALTSWRSTPGAVTWLRGARQASRKKKQRKAPAAEGPSPIGMERLRRLPQEYDVWQADCRQLAFWVGESEDRFRPWIVVVVSSSEGLILGNVLFEQEPTSDMLWDALETVMRRPAVGDPHRPVEIRVRPDSPFEPLTPHLDEVSVSLSPADVLGELDLVFESLTSSLGADQPPDLLEMPGVTEEQVGQFYSAAAEFYRKAPWKWLGSEEAIRVECDRFESGPWYAVIMGQSGLTLGLALYEDLDFLRRLWSGDLTDEESARETVALSVTYDSAEDTAAPELEATEQYGWEVAGPEAFPSVFRKERGMNLRPPLAWELELLEGCLRAIPEFAIAHRQADASHHTMALSTASGTLELTLSWVSEV